MDRSEDEKPKKHPVFLFRVRIAGKPRVAEGVQRDWLESASTPNKATADPSRAGRFAFNTQIVKFLFMSILMSKWTKTTKGGASLTGDRSPP